MLTSLTTQVYTPVELFDVQRQFRVDMQRSMKQIIYTVSRKSSLL